MQGIEAQLSKPLLRVNGHQKCHHKQGEATQTDAQRNPGASVQGSFPMESTVKLHSATEMYETHQPQEFFRDSVSNIPVQAGNCLE